MQNLVLGSEGMYIYKVLGCLHRNRETLLTISTYETCSSSSIVCLLLSIGLTPAEITTDFWYTDVLNEYSISDDKEELLIRCITERYGFVPTMKELENLTEKSLRITVYNLTKERIEVFSAKTVPNMSCVTACLFASSKISTESCYSYCGNIYCDASLYQPIPISQSKENEKVLCVYTTIRDLKPNGLATLDSTDLLHYSLRKSQDSCKERTIECYCDENWLVMKLDVEFSCKDPSPDQRISMSQSGSGKVITWPIKNKIKSPCLLLSK